MSNDLFMIQIGCHPAFELQGGQAQRARAVCRQRHCGYLEAGSPESGLPIYRDQSARATNDPLQQKSAPTPPPASDPIGLLASTQLRGS